ncbi:response regulator [Paenibacillus alkaliterrae]|uniref:response regulator transcription factor n=1 Tax=Paenibacillus alkaliterrae TaxID=320909 RepID=UPI001F3D51F9|nr:response regulator [Paenibacillus alkaliterrae]MCF2939412.1 response regulator [Paenibacillus alkaliterrae]
MIGKLLIVDDEVWFREGLTKLIGNSQLGWEVIGEASDGEEALAAIETYEPNLIITDINMPVMNGLALAERLHQSGKDIMVIILTGYRDFEYAQKALRHGAVEFLLKPLSLDETRRVLQKAYERFRLNELKKKVKEQERQANALRAAILRLPFDKAEWKSLSLEWDGYQFYLLRIDSFFPPDKSYSDRDIGLLHYAVSNIISELLQLQQIKGSWLPLKSQEYAFVMEQGEEAAVYRTLVQNTVKQLIGLTINWFDGGTLQGLEKLSSLYDNINSNGHDGLTDVWISPNRSYQLKEEIVSALIIGDYMGAGVKIDAQLRSASQLGLQECKAEMYTLMTVFSDILMTDFKHLKEASYEDLNPSSILLMSSTESLLEWASSKSRDFIQLFARWMQEKQDNVVERAKHYIELHYREVCTLQMAAACVHVTPNYLSNLFKRETGIGFTNYVSGLRVDKAKALLRGTKLKMTEIAEQTGFDNSSYFTAVFKQLTGMSPSDFRKEHG